MTISDKNSYQYYNVTGSDTYTFTKDWLSTDHIEVELVNLTTGLPVAKTVAAGDFTFENANNATPTVQIVFASAPTTANTVTENGVRIRRVTPKGFTSRSVDFTAGAYLNETDLETNQKQVWLLIQEALETDDAGAINPSAEYIRYDAATTRWLATRLGVNTIVGGAKDPTSNDDLATKAYVDSIATYAAAGVPLTWEFTAADSAVEYTLTDGANQETKMCLVAINGVLKLPETDYNIVKGNPNSTLKLAAAPTNGHKISVIAIGKHRYLNNLALEDNSIEARHISSGAVTSTKLAVDSVTAGAIAADAVGASEIAADAVGASEIAAAAVLYANLATSGFTSAPGGTIDQFMAVTAGSGAQALRTLAAADINDLATWLGTRVLSELAAPTGNVAMNTKKITGLANGTDAADVVNKSQLDAAVSGGALSKIVLVHNETLGSDANTWNFDVTGGTFFNADYHWYQVVFTNVRVIGTSTIYDVRPQLYYEVGGSAGWQAAGAPMTLDSGSGGLIRGTLAATVMWEFVMHGVSTSKGAQMYSKIPEDSTGWPTKAAVATNMGMVLNSGLEFVAGTRVQIYGHKV